MQFNRFEDFVTFVRERYKEETWNASKEIANAFNLSNNYLFLDYLPGPICLDDCISPFDECIILFVSTLRALQERRFPEAFSLQMRSAMLFSSSVVRSRSGENWFLPIVYQLSVNVWNTALQADENSPVFSEEERNKCLRHAASCIMGFYRDFAGDLYTRPEVSKRIGILKLTNMLLRIYYELEQWDVLKPLVKAIDDSGELWHSFSLSDKVCYNYVTGCRSGCDFTLKECSERLTAAFNSCPSKYRKNRRVILRQLIPINVLLGKMPKRKLLVDFGFSDYESLLAAVRVGDIATVEELINTNLHRFVGNSSWSFVLRLRKVCYRNLFKIMWTVFGDKQIPLQYFVAAFQMLKMENMDVPAIECLLASMIYAGQIKGYISHALQTLTLSQEDPFPPIQETRWIF